MRNYYLHFIRHGQTEDNTRPVYCGRRTDTELSVDGIRQLIDLKETYEYPSVGIVFSSPMTRCVQTAGILYPGRELLTHDGLAEMDFGEFDGKTFDELRDREGFKEWVGHSNSTPPPGGETTLEVLGRFAGAMDAMVKHMSAIEVYDAAVITHGGIISAMLASLALPRLSPAQRVIANGRGYTCYVNPQLWQRDRIIEVAGIMPHGAENAAGDISPEMLEALRRGGLMQD